MLQQTVTAKGKVNIGGINAWQATTSGRHAGADVDYSSEQSNASMHANRQRQAGAQRGAHLLLTKSSFASCRQCRCSDS